jgi:hypothetical protein
MEGEVRLIEIVPRGIGYEWPKVCFKQSIAFQLASLVSDFDPSEKEIEEAWFTSARSRTCAAFGIVFCRVI